LVDQTLTKLSHTWRMPDYNARWSAW